MSSKTVRTLYRLFLRQARALERQGLEELPIRAPVNREAWMGGPQHEWAPPRDEFYLQSFKRLVPWAAQDATSGVLTPAHLRELVRRTFRAPPPEEGGRARQLDQAFESLRLLADQVALDEATSSCTTDGVHVEVSTAHMGSQAELDPLYDDEDDGSPKKHYWTYRIRVSNLGSETVQLLGRHWLISDPSGKIVTEVPKGSRGVVGCTPLIKPGDCFQYYSGTDLETPGGSMRGSFQMAVVDPKKPHAQWLRTFDAEVAPFPFIMPGDSRGSSGSGSSSGGSSSGTA
ncbi:hypothetical protein C2E21_9247 [Chlorella sorokiniana]|uniref:ApaG domain-containing protein n=1 Tax=Chlorella sorokiniana TaxID=3076 RepID=A0A2P6TC08_CHLSO|nr:hypothetical protein C2E21_9247 [Chlorella sorokiniana]|eukprot:PRW20169.1 hypothetical protein C2E21_9247 [Chlorella sorokiniana]